MAKIYDESGNAMNMQQILGEISNTINDGDALTLGKAINMQTEGKNSLRKLSHAILDSYAAITDDRIKKLLNRVMIRYQKSTTPASNDDQSAYHSLMCDILKKAGIN